jgi:hypothetical protein
LGQQTQHLVLDTAGQARASPAGAPWYPWASCMVWNFFLSGDQRKKTKASWSFWLGQCLSHPLLSSFLPSLSLSLPTLLNYNWHITNFTYLKFTIWWVLTCVYTCEITTITKISKVSITGKVSYCLSVINSSFYLFPQVASDMPFVTLD